LSSLAESYEHLLCTTALQPSHLTGSSSSANIISNLVQLLIFETDRHNYVRNKFLNYIVVMLCNYNE